MLTFFKKTSKAFIFLSGLFTITPISLAFAPKPGLEMIFNLQFILEYTILVQHWGVLVPVLGIFICIAAFKAKWRPPILMLAGVGKSAFFIFYFINANQAFATGFKQAAIFDLVISIYFFTYLYYHKKVAN